MILMIACGYGCSYILVSRALLVGDPQLALRICISSVDVVSELRNTIRLFRVSLVQEEGVKVTA